jgi:hypothetical protein
MTIYSCDNERFISVGRNEIFFSLYSTVVYYFGKSQLDLRYAIQFLKTGNCSCRNALATARQINLVRDNLSTVLPEQCIFDINDLSKKAPWHNNLSPAITSCGNLYTTSDGKDLLYELVSILVYADIAKTDVKCEQ